MFYDTEFELRALCFLGWCSTTWAMPLVLFDLGILWVGAHIYSQAGLDHDSPIQASSIAGMAGLCHHAHLLIH
jgi:hypothetical protein